MSRWVTSLIFVAAASLAAQDAPPQQQPPAKSSDTSKTQELKRDRPPQPTSDQQEVPPEEDKSLAHDEYTFNPMQSQRDVEVGDEYRKKGNYKAAAHRYLEGTLHNDGNGQAWLKLGEAREKLKDPKAAIEAYNKYLEIDPKSKTAEKVRQELARLSK